MDIVTVGNPSRTYTESKSTEKSFAADLKFLQLRDALVCDILPCELGPRVRFVAIPVRPSRLDSVGPAIIPDVSRVKVHLQMKMRYGDRRIEVRTDGMHESQSERAMCLLRQIDRPFPASLICRRASDVRLVPEVGSGALRQLVGSRGRQGQSSRREAATSQVPDSADA